MPDPIQKFTIGTGDDEIEFKIKTNAPFNYSNGENGPARTVTYQVKGGKGPKACDALYGVGVYVFTAPDGTSTYPKPHRFPNNLALTVHAVRGEPVGGWQTDPQLAAGIEYDQVTADYLVNSLDVDGTEQETTSRAGIEVPWSSLAIRGEEGEIAINKNSILSNGVRIPSNAKTLTIPDPTKEYIYQRGMIPNLIDFEDVLDPILGCVNDDVFFGYPAGTLLMGPWDTRIQMDATGKRNQEFTMSIKYRKNGWNSRPDDDDPRMWVPVTTTADGSSPIPEASFQPIIEFRVIA